MSEFMKLLGSNMRLARQRNRLTQEQVAQSINMPVEVYGRMERGSMLPRMEMFVAICQALGVTPDQMLGYSHTQPDLAKRDS